MTDLIDPDSVTPLGWAWICFWSSFYTVCSPPSIMLATGVACLVVISSTKREESLDCGLVGSPPLAEWVFGTGIAYVFLWCFYALLFCGRPWKREGKLAKLYLVLITPFVLAWAIVGSLSLWKWGTDCQSLNLKLWRMGFAAVVISFLLFCYGFLLLAPDLLACFGLTIVTNITESHEVVNGNSVRMSKKRFKIARTKDVLEIMAAPEP